jgi:hypothetical protein
MKLRENMKENLLCLIAGTITAVALIALIMGDGNKGLLEIF